MKIKAMRVAQFGCFDAPIRIENFSGGLDVLAGPNELGKSTLLDALKAVFTEKHSTKSTSSALGRRVPYGGGAPRIEVDFDIGDNAYSLRKQFLSKPGAELTLRGKATPLARNDEVDLKLAELFASDKGALAKTGLLWLGQGDTLRAIDLKNDENNVLRGLIERDVVDMGGGSKARAIAELINKDLGALVTASRGQPTGEYKAALKAQDDLRRDLDSAREASEGAKTVRAKLDAAKTALNAKSTSAIADEISRRVLNAEKDHASAIEAGLKLQGAQAQVENLTLLEEQAKKERGQYAQALEQYSILRPALAEGQEARLEAASKVEEAKQDIDKLELEDGNLKTERQALTNEERLIRASEDYTTHGARLEKISLAIDKAGIEMTALTAVSDQMKPLAPVTVDGLRDMENEERAINQLEDRLSAVTTKVSIHYNDGVSDRIDLDGKALADGATIDALAPTTLNIEGVGRIKIDPGPMAAGDDLTNELKSHRANLDELLKGVDLASVSDARVTLHKAQEFALEKRTIKARIDAVAPDGLDGLKQEQTKIQATLDEITAGSTEIGGDQPLRTREELSRDLAALQENETQLAAAFRNAHDAHAKTQTMLVELDGQLRARKSELETLENKLPEDEAAQRAQLEAFDEKILVHTRERTQAIQLAQSYRDQAPDGAQKAKLETELEAAHTTSKAHQSEVQNFEREIIALNATLAQIGDANNPASLSELETRYERVSERVRKYQDEIAALKLLRTELDRSMAEIRENYLEPVTNRLAPYFDMVFPEMTFGLGDGFSIDKVIRDGRNEDIGKLSEGTQEQIAVLTRLGFGRLLADQGAPMPLILDDALIYSDDERLAKVFGALGCAAEHHQVIMLTCRAASFEGLGGTRLKIEKGDF